MIKTILITGGTGLLGKPLVKKLIDKGYQIHLLSRSNLPETPGVRVFDWDIYNQKIDADCIVGVDAIIHLVGEGIAEKPWTNKRKKQIIESRTVSIRLIYGLLKNNPNHQVKHVISASAVGYYSDRGYELLTEDSSPNNDFLAHSCVEWEKAVDEGMALGLRIVKFRTGIVLSDLGGALPQLDKTIKLNIGSPLANGKQWISWIHLNDAVNMYLFAIENPDLHGAYNMAAPNPATNKQLTEAIAKELNKVLWAPNVPKFVLRVILGKMVTAVIGSTKVSVDKIQEAGFKFNYPDLEGTLHNLYA